MHYQGQIPAGWPFDPKRPWNYVWSKILTDDKWWEKEFEKPALVILTTKAHVGDALGSEAPIGRQVPPGTPLGLDHTHQGHFETATGDPPGHRGGHRQTEGPPSPHKEPRQTRARHHNVTNGVHTTSCSGVRLCHDFNSDTGCAQAVGGQWCPVRYALIPHDLMLLVCFDVSCHA